jgi:ParB-like chromosome segregation protein Spo0J
MKYGNKMEIINRNPKELLKADYNPRKISDKDFKQLKKSLETFQCVEPIIVNQYEGRENVIVGGHQRLKAMLDLGWSEVPTIEVHLDIDEEKELNVRLNKNTGEFDFELLTDLFELDKLEEIGFDPDDLPSLVEYEEDNIKDLSNDIEVDFKIEISLVSEKDQEQLYNRLTEEGYECRVLTL